MTLADTLRAAATKAGLGADFSCELKLSDPKFGDLQLNGAMAYGKAHKLNPREVAQKFVDALELDRSQVQVTLAGPGFVNFAFTPVALISAIAGYSSAAALSPQSRLGQRVLVDFGSPNVGKQMHVGNMRSYNIGAALANIVEFCGAKVHRDNHLGDWGTTFGYIIYAIKDQKVALNENDNDALILIDRLYKYANDKAKSDPTVLEAARNEVAKLQSGDAENTALWKKIVAATLHALSLFHARYGIKYDTALGESFFNDKVARVYAELTELGLAKEDAGALVVFHPEHPRFKEQPFIIRKSDGAANYGSSDLAAMLYRVEVQHATAIYIVVDQRQSDHFEQLALTSKKWFAAKGYSQPDFQHVSFGMILGDDNRPLKTRSGETVKLFELLAEATERAQKIVEEKSPELAADEKKLIAEAIGIGAIRYADLAQNRTSDYQFNWDRLLAFEGNTAPYQLYAIARIYSLFEKSGINPAALTVPTSLSTDAEIALARKLLNAPTIIGHAAAELRPHYLCTYLYELTSLFGSFYNADRIMGESEEVKNRRLWLASKTLLVLETGLHLLGLKTLKRM